MSEPSVHLTIEQAGAIATLIPPLGNQWALALLRPAADDRQAALVAELETERSRLAAKMRLDGRGNAATRARIRGLDFALERLAASKERA